MYNIRLKLEYDGTDYVGWQFQKNGKSIQEEIEKAISKIYQVNVRITGAGRTDAGVHAKGQIANFIIDKEIELGLVAHSLNAVLPKDIIVLEAENVSLDFNARYSAKSRRYSYCISQAPTAVDRKYCWQVYQELEYELLQKCAKQIIGEHEFRSFCKQNEYQNNYLCIVSSALWKKHENKLIFNITANRFLHGMVRSLVGTMVNVGRGHTEYNKFTDIINAKDRSTAGMSAPAKGLFLEEIFY